jgi:pyruvate-formate lyase
LLDREQAKELLQCFWIKFNNHPAPPKVGVTAEESGTYNDFTNINLGGIMPDGSDGVNELSYLMLEVMDEIHLLQPQGNIQLSRKNPDRFLKAACRVIRNGYGYPSVFNADGVVEQMVRCGKRIEDAREGGTSGCVETGAFGKEAYILTGYLNTPKILEITLNNGVDPRTGKRIGIETGDPRSSNRSTTCSPPSRTSSATSSTSRCGATRHHRAALRRQHARGVPVGADRRLHRQPARTTTPAAPATTPRTSSAWASARSPTASRPSASTCSGPTESVNMDDAARRAGIGLRGRRGAAGAAADQTPRYGNDDDRPTDHAAGVRYAGRDAIDGRPNARGGKYHVDMLPTTCHIYFGSVMGASADGRRAGRPVSEGISPVQGADRHGPTAVIKSAAKMDHFAPAGRC